MQQFNLEEWLKDKSRKICTRDGRIVEILKVDAKGNHPIIGIYQFSDTEDMESSWRIDGKKAENEVSILDLFFADEDDEFETTMISFSHAMFDHLLNTNVKVDVKEWKNKLLDLARKEIRKEQQKKLGTLEMPIDVTEPYYIKGKQDALKDLPKWKKAEKDEELDCHVAIQQDDRVVLSDFVQKDEYYITLDVLKKLPKEE